MTKGGIVRRKSAGLSDPAAIAVKRYKAELEIIQQVSLPANLAANENTNTGKKYRHSYKYK